MYESIIYGKGWKQVAKGQTVKIETIRNKKCVTESEIYGDRISLGSLFLDKRCN